MAILNTRLQLRGANFTQVFGIPKIFLGMHPLPLKGVSNGNTVTIAGIGEGNIEVRNQQVGQKSTSRAGSNVLRRNSSKVYRSKNRKTKRDNTESVSGGSINNGKSKKNRSKKGQKRVKGRFAK